jgi:hypothetical protein
MQFKDLVLAEASTEAKVAALAVLVDKELVKLAEIVLSTKKLEGPKGEQGLQGPKGEQGDRGQDGSNGLDGRDGVDGKDGKDGQNGVGVSNAYVDFDGSLVIELTDGRQINAGDVVPEGAADKIKLVKSGGGNSQPVLDDIAALEAAVAALQTTVATYGTMALQNKTSVDIEGGTIDNTVIGGTTPVAGTFTTLIGGKDQVNYGQLTGGATTKAIEFKSIGSDTNVALAIRTQGTGAIDLAAGSRGVNISNGGTVTAITRTAAGSGYTSVPSVAISAPTTAGGVQATATATVVINGITSIQSGGTGYTVGDVLTVQGGTNTGQSTTLTVTSVSGGVVTAVSITLYGSYTVAPTNPASVTGGTGTGATFNLNYAVQTTFTITNAGSGYVEQPTVTFSGGGGSGAAAYATVGAGAVIRALGATGTQSLSLATANGEAVRIRDIGGADSYMMIQPASGLINFIAQGGTNAAFNFNSNGTGNITFNTNGTSGVNQMRVSHTASAVNYVQVTGSTTGNSSGPTISAQGSDAAVPLRISAKGGSTLLFSNNGTTVSFQISNTTNQVNNLQVTGGAAGSPPSMSAQGSDTNIDLTLTPKGTGLVRFGTRTASADAAITGYIEIKDSGGTTRRLAIIG